MRRVVVTGMGIVSSIGNNTQEVLASLREAKSGISRADEYATLGFRCQVHGAPTLDPSESVDRRAMRFLGRGAAWNHVAMEQAIRDAGLEENDVSNERTGIIMGSGGPSTRTIVEAAQTTKEKGPEARRPVRGAEGDVVHRVGDARHLVQDQGRELFDLVGLRDLQPLHRQRRRDDPVGQAGHGVRRRLRGSRLDHVGAVRRHGRDVVGLQPDAGQGFARLRPRPRRLRDRRRRRRAGARGAGARQGARRENLRRGRRLWRDLRRPRHGGAVGRGRGALHEDGARRRQRAGRLHQSARHLDADRRHQGDRGDPRGVRRQVPADLGDQVADRPFARRHRRAGGDLLDADDAERLHLRERQHREHRSGDGRHADRARAAGQREARLRAVELVRLRRHQRIGRVQAAGA